LGFQIAIVVPTEIFKDLRSKAVIFLLLTLGILAYGRVLPFPFVHDDIVFIQKNLHLARWDDIGRIFLFSSSFTQHLSIANSYYRPFLEIIYKCEYALFGFAPWGYHLTNILLHILNSILLFKTIQILFIPNFAPLKAGQNSGGFCPANGGTKSGVKKNITAFGVAALFLLHPVQTEAVSCIAGISNLVFTFFCFSSFLCYLQARAQKGKTIFAFDMCAYVLFIAALLSKEQAVIFPAVIIFYEIFFASGQTSRYCERMLRVSVFVMIAIGYFVFRKMILHITPIPIDLNNPELVLRLLSIPRTLFMYLGLVLWPAGLHYYRCLDILRPFFLPTVGMLALVVGVERLLKMLPVPERKMAAFGIGWFLLTIFPVLNIVPLVVEYSYVMTSEHFLYFSLPGLFLFLFVTGEYALRRVWFSPSGARLDGQGFCPANGGTKSGFILMLCVLLALTVKQNGFWKDAATLFERTLRYEQGVARIHILLAQTYYDTEKIEEAIAEYSKAQNIMQGYAQKVKDDEAKRFYFGFLKGIHFELALCYEKKEDYRQAVFHYQQALAIDSKDDVVYNNLALAYLNLQDNARAYQILKTAIGINPRNVMALSNLAILELQQGNMREGEDLLKRALAVDPDFAAARKNFERLQMNKPR